MKNWSFNKILMVFVAFMVLVFIGCLVVAKSMQKKNHTQVVMAQAPENQTPENQPSPTQVKATLHSQSDNPAVLQPQFSLSAKDEASINASDNGAQKPGAAQNQTAAAPSTASPVASDQSPFVLTQAQAKQIADHAVKTNDALEKLEQRVQELEKKLSESERSKLTAASSPKKTSTKAHLKSNAAKDESDDAGEKNATVVNNYRTMAIVSGRAWTQSSSGVDESVARGDAFHGAKVDALNQDSGVVITSSERR